jgi:hypothetical protein
MDSGLGVGVDVGILLFALLERPSRVGVVEIGGRREMKAWFGPGEDLDCRRGEGESIEPVMMEVRNESDVTLAVQIAANRRLLRCLSCRRNDPVAEPGDDNKETSNILRKRNAALKGCH